MADGGRRRSILVPTDLRTIVALVGIVLLICGTSLVFAPALTAQTAHGDAQFEAATTIAEHAGETEREYPETYVLSNWGDNRMYNYFVNGESETYSYASQTFGEFQTDDDPDGWYERFDEDDVGYVVMTGSSGYHEESSHVQLHNYLGTGSAETEPLEHYRTIYVSSEATAFAVVPGATITVPGEPGETVALETEVTVTGVTFPTNGT